MVPVASLVFMAVSALICFAVPLGGLVYLTTRRTADGSRRYPAVGRAFLCGMLAFGISQLLIRIPLMLAVVPQLPAPVAGFLLSAPVASFSAGLFEETGRLVVMVLLLKQFHRWIDGISFGLGHGGLEAMALMGSSAVGNLVVGVMINTGRWDAVAEALPAGQGEMVRQGLASSPPTLFLLSGVERIGAIGLHVGLSVLVLWGVQSSHRLLAWTLAVLIHGLANLTAVGSVQAGASPWVAEVIVWLWAAAILVWAVRIRPAFPTTIGVAPPRD